MRPQPWQLSPTDALRFLEGASGTPLALRVSLCTLPRSESVLLPLVHGHLCGHQESGQRVLGCIGHVLLELLLEVFLKQLVEAIFLVSETFVNLARSEASCSSGMTPKSARDATRSSEYCIRSSRPILSWSTKHGLPHRLDQLVPLVVGAGEGVSCREG